jgi:ADP-ribose pyrophosphatase YjhB (NUDIX family)
MTDAQRRTSAGGVVVRRGASPEICLIRPSGSGRRVWGLPKGGIEEGETATEAAVREVREETGVDAVVERELGSIDYAFYSRDRTTRIHKTVHYFLMRAVGGDTSRHDQEVHEARWVRVPDALQMMTYPNEREMVRRAAALLGEASLD